MIQIRVARWLHSNYDYYCSVTTISTGPRLKTDIVIQEYHVCMHIHNYVTQLLYMQIKNNLKLHDLFRKKYL